jgi:hypothetical protein
MREVRVAVPISAVGYGINEETFSALGALRPDVIAADAGSTDSGPFYLGTGRSNKARAAVYHDLLLMLRTSRRLGVPMVVGNAGTSGTSASLEWMLDVLLECARQDGLTFRLAIISSELDKRFIHESLGAGAITPLVGVAQLRPDRIDACTHIVGQMGVEPYIRAFNAGADVVLGGRSCDSAIIGSFPIWKGFDTSLSLHMGKVTECAAMCAWPATGRDGIMGIVRESDFVIETPNPRRQITPFSVAAHMIYESEHPYIQEEPGGTQDFADMRIVQLTDRSAAVSGSRYTPRSNPTLKIEGSAPVGFRSFLIGGLRDPFLIARLDTFIGAITQEVISYLGSVAHECQIDWKVYGRDAVMGPMEPTPSVEGLHEVGVLVQVLGPTQEIAHDVCQFTEARMIGYSYPGSKTRSANVAFPMSPLIHDSGPVYRFDVYHVVQLENWEQFETIFPVHIIEVTQGDAGSRKLLTTRISSDAHRRADVS